MLQPISVLVGTARVVTAVGAVAVIGPGRSVGSVVGGAAVSSVTVIAVSAVGTVPGSAAVVRMASVSDVSSVPVNRPRVPSPTCDNNRRLMSAPTAMPAPNESTLAAATVPGGVSGHHVWRAEDYGGVVLRHIDDLRICWLDDDGARRSAAQP